MQKRGKLYYFYVYLFNEQPRTRANRAKHLSRVGAEYTQLLYHVSKAQTEKCAFVDECQWVCETST